MIRLHFDSGKKLKIHLSATYGTKQMISMLILCFSFFIPCFLYKYSVLCGKGSVFLTALLTYACKKAPVISKADDGVFRFNLLIYKGKKNLVRYQRSKNGW
ncbi:hypothetical protein [Dickeya lacustris]|uniref:Uncharacterized protein n=1 Tax=Dickeya lacustris TaxID=2259638 RepID=A0ABY8GAG4_9GAMM|nr:hypothetical protein [Dickeya lacustris]WFN56925.1 hypothetical protein O1Q98_06665 [Dickeya lacustris]